jgi:hypothetical protein
MITPIRKPECRELLDWEKEFNTQVNKIRYLRVRVKVHTRLRSARQMSWFVMIFARLQAVRRASSATLTPALIRYLIEQVIANFKTWRIMHTDYRRPLDTFDTTISAVVGLHFSKMA